MKIEVVKSVALKKRRGSFEFSYVPTQNLCLIPLCGIGEVKVWGEYEIYEDFSVGVNLNVKYEISGKCSYCLKDCKQEVCDEFDISFDTQSGGEDYTYDGKTIDLTVAVCDAILLSQPKVLLCDKDCNGFL